MTHYNGSVPETPRKPDWRDQSACLTEDPDLFSPDGTAGKWVQVIADAKAICGRCVVQDACLQWALDTRQEFGILGGLTEDERWNLRRNQARNARRAARNPRGPRQSEPASLRELLDRNTKAEAGHLLWTGAKTPEFRRWQLTPNRIAFIVDRGYEPNGMVHRTCGVPGCVLGVHLADTQERHQQAAQARAAA